MDKHVGIEDKQYQGTVYYLARSLLLVAPELHIGANDKTHHRNSFRLFIAHNKPVRLEFIDGQVIECHTLLMSPKAGRLAMIASESNISLFDFAVASPEYALFEAVTREKPLIKLDANEFKDLLPKLEEAQNGALSSNEVKSLMEQVVFLSAGRWPEPVNYDERITAAIQLIEELPLTEISVIRLAKEACLSPDRFRHLFKEVTGSTVSRYARSSAIWRAMKLLDKGITITEISHTVGFHDVSHFYHAYSEQFGVSLSDRLNPRKFKRVRCV